MFKIGQKVRATTTTGWGYIAGHDYTVVSTGVINLDITSSNSSEFDGVLGVSHLKEKEDCSNCAPMLTGCDPSNFVAVDFPLTPLSMPREVVLALPPTTPLMTPDEFDQNKVYTCKTIGGVFMLHRLGDETAQWAWLAMNRCAQAYMFKYDSGQEALEVIKHSCNEVMEFSSTLDMARYLTSAVVE